MAPWSIFFQELVADNAVASLPLSSVSLIPHIPTYRLTKQESAGWAGRAQVSTTLSCGGPISQQQTQTGQPRPLSQLTQLHADRADGIWTLRT